MAEWKLHIPSDDNRIVRYQCGLEAGQYVALRKDVIGRHWDGTPTGVVHPAGEVWQVLPGITYDPVVFLLRPDGERCTWDDTVEEVHEWFSVVEPTRDGAKLYRLAKPCDGARRA